MRRFCDVTIFLLLTVAWLFVSKIFQKVVQTLHNTTCSPTPHSEIQSVLTLKSTHATIVASGTFCTGREILAPYAIVYQPIVYQPNCESLRTMSMAYGIKLR